MATDHGACKVCWHDQPIVAAAALRELGGLLAEREQWGEQYDKHDYSFAMGRAEDLIRERMRQRDRARASAAQKRAAREAIQQAELAAEARPLVADFLDRMRRQDFPGAELVGIWYVFRWVGVKRRFRQKAGWRVGQHSYTFMNEATSSPVYLLVDGTFAYHMTSFSSGPTTICQLESLASETLRGVIDNLRGRLARLPT